jgi:hypothetical protein
MLLLPGPAIASGHRVPVAPVVAAVDLQPTIHFVETASRASDGGAVSAGRTSFRESTTTIHVLPFLFLVLVVAVVFCVAHAVYEDYKRSR